MELDSLGGPDTQRARLVVLCEADEKANTGVSPLRFAPVEMTDCLGWFESI
jgi:hypothetical protein